MSGRDGTDVAGRLAEALARQLVPLSTSRRLAAALLPVVREIADQRAAEELEAAASGIAAATGVKGLPVAVIQALTIAATTVDARAAALRGEAGDG